MSARKLLLVAIPALALYFAHAGLAPTPDAAAPDCQVHVWDGNPPYDCLTPVAEGDDA